MNESANPGKGISAGSARSRTRADAVARTAFMAFGGVNLVLGIAGALLPLVPSTVFLLIAAWCFSRSSSRFAAWLYGHKRFGPALCRWRDARIVPLQAKLLATVSITASLIVLHAVDPQIGFAKWAATAICLGVIGFLLSRPHRLPGDTNIAAAVPAE